jgi:hypothetical protein
MRARFKAITDKEIRVRAVNLERNTYRSSAAVKSSDSTPEKIGIMISNITTKAAVT